jgi:single-strand DNA-binding protein
MMHNRIEISGFIAGKLQLRYLPSGTPVANGRLGQTYRYQTSDGTKEHTNWFSLSFYGELATVGLTYEKGDNVDITGTIQQREFTPKDGSRRTVYEIVVQRCHLIAPPRIASSVLSPPVEEAEEEPYDAWSLL